MRATDAKKVPPRTATSGARDVRTLVVDDQLPVRDALRELVGVTPGFHLVGEVCSGEDAIVAVDTVSPHLVLMDVRMPGIGGIEAASRLAHQHPEVFVILISVHGADELPPELVKGTEDATFVYKQALRPRLLRQLWEDRQGR